MRVAHVIILRFAASIEDLHMQEVLAADALQYSKRHVHEFTPCMGAILAVCHLNGVLTVLAVWHALRHLPPGSWQGMARLAICVTTAAFYYRVAADGTLRASGTRLFSTSSLPTHHDEPAASTLPPPYPSGSGR